MSGVVAIRQLLVGSEPLVALVPASRVISGALPQGAPLPALVINSVSATEEDVISVGPTRFVSERVQVTVFARNLPEQKGLLLAVKRAAADKVPDLIGGRAMPVTTAGTGPDFQNETASIWMGTQDFIVRFNEPT